MLVNGSPTDEFHFFRGICQGDPLCPFLFILVMEAFNVSFKRAVRAGFFYDIILGDTQPVYLSHMFYVDDAVFIGYWKLLNFKNNVHVLKCFHLASGLKINIQKSKLLGTGVQQSEVEEIASSIGCASLKASFVFGSYGWC